MHIVLVTPYYAPEYKFGGPIRKIASLARHLTRRGHEVSVVTLHSERPRAHDRALIDGVAVQHLSWIGSGQRQFPTGTAELRKCIGEADVVHLFGLYNFICPIAAKYARWHAVPFFIEPMGMAIPRVRSFRAKRVYNHLFTRHLFKNAAAVIATSQLEANEIHGWYSSVNVVVRRNGIEIPPGCGANRHRIRAEWGVRENDLLIGYIGRISANKGLVNLVRAFERMRNARTKLLIAGPVSDASSTELQSAIRASPRRAEITFRGPLFGQEHAAILTALDVFVLPSESENFGNAAGEAVAAGVPVLVTRQCGIAPIIDQQFGIAVDQGVENLRRGLEEMLQPETRKRWNFDREKVEAALGWDEPVNEMLALYETAVSQSRKRKVER